MKHKVFVLALTLASMMANAKPVSTETAQQAAATFLHLDAKGLSEMPLQWSTMHLFAIDRGGFVLTSADDCVKPILGYSTSGKWRVTAHFLEDDVIYGIEGIDAPDGNWFSNDSGATWGHLTDYEKPSSYCDDDVMWFIRCITKTAGAAVGIGEIENSELRIVNNGLNVRIENPDGERVQIYDITGRQLATSRLSPFTFHLPSPGVYMVKIGNLPARKIVAIR